MDLLGIRLSVGDRVDRGPDLLFADRVGGVALEDGLRRLDDLFLGERALQQRELREVIPRGYASG